MSQLDSYKHRTYNISDKVYEHAKLNNINLSAEFNRLYIEKHLSFQAKQHKIKELELQLEQLRGELDSTILDLIASTSISQQEYLKGVRAKVAKGLKIEPILSTYNSIFRKRITVDDFKILIDYFDPIR